MHCESGLPGTSPLSTLVSHLVSIHSSPILSTRCPKDIIRLSWLSCRHVAAQLSARQKDTAVETGAKEPGIEISAVNILATYHDCPFRDLGHRAHYHCQPPASTRPDLGLTRTA